MNGNSIIIWTIMPLGPFLYSHKSALFWRFLAPISRFTQFPSYIELLRGLLEKKYPSDLWENALPHKSSEVLLGSRKIMFCVLYSFLYQFLLPKNFAPQISFILNGIYYLLVLIIPDWSSKSNVSNYLNTKISNYCLLILKYSLL